MGVTKNLATARSWYQKAADQDDVGAIRKVGTMMVKGEGGAMKGSKGVALWEKASAKGDEAAQANLNLLRGVSFRMC